MRVFGIGLGLLASAFSPLLIALVLVAQPLPGFWWNLGLAAVCALPILLLALVFRGVRRIGPEPLDVKTATPKDTDVLTFMASYLVPIAIAFFAPDGLRAAAMVILLVLLVAVYSRAELFHLNPILSVIGFRLYQVVDTAGATSMLLTRRRTVLNESTIDDARLFARSIYLDLDGRA